MTRQNALKLTLYFGERDRIAGRFLADVLIDVYERHALCTSILLRGVEGFGIKQHLHTQRILTLSEDLPLVSVAVDSRENITAAVPEIEGMMREGLITLERAQMLTEQIGPVVLSEGLHEATKLTVYCGRQERIDGRLAYLAIVDLLYRRGIAGATVLLGVDGTAHGRRERARFFSPNAEVPLMIIAVGDGAAIARVLPELGGLLARPLMTVERVGLCKQDGQLLTEPRALPNQDDTGMPIWQKLMIFADEQARYAGRPMYLELIECLRLAGASGATAVRGIWGYHGEHPPHGDKLLALRRHVPVVTVVVDTPERIRRWFAIVNAVTAETGLVTSELVPAFRAVGPDIERGHLHLAGHRFR